MRDRLPTRKVDRFGRVVLPVEIRERFAVGEGDGLEISVDGERIVLTVQGGMSGFDDKARIAQLEAVVEAVREYFERYPDDRAWVPELAEALDALDQKGS